MGLSIEVGIVTDLLEHDEEGAEYFVEQFSTLSRYLATVGLRPHVDPEDVEVWSCDMYGYSGLHYLRRFAAHVHYGLKLPSPGDDHASKDPMLARYYADFDRRAANGTPGSFDHLILHSDAEGYYLPQDFEAVLIPGADFPVAGGMVGSSHRLLEETLRLATLLELPLDLDPEDDRVFMAADSQGTGATLWERYGRESFSCLRLHHAAGHSIATGAAIVFT
ncbi:hypothetical protein [Verrucomicrobium sp. BvORR106]|uniref:hypothetical protein n=1 Tax=Verrucomicrobium sp. BvORR106 TaxID=1403819 RepID=UPI00057075BF|nr:hypothetical protein [Verrucomicrobium sp. BvORR106]